MTAPTRPVARATWTAAADRAALASEQRLPCPGCAASVKGANLTAHVHRAHLTGPTAMAPGHPVHVGHDRRRRRATRWAVVLWLAAVAGLAAASPTALTDAATALGDEPTVAVARHHLGVVAGTTAGSVLLGGLAVLVVGLLVGRGERGRAAVTVTNREVVLRHRYGTGTVRVALPARLEAGTLIRHHRASGGGEGSGDVTVAYDERVGSYLRIADRHRAITVGCPNGTRVRKHWEGWVPGPTRRRWDITMEPVDFVALQYALASVGVLGVRPRG